MYRNMPLLADRQYDLLVIGGGIYGACIAWDASLRGLSVALVDKGDFGSATSANSLKMIHGGLRYLQDANLQRMRLMVRERRNWMRIAPHLVRPLPCILPTGEKLSRHKITMSVALAVNDLVSFDRNIGVAQEHHLANGRMLSQSEFMRYVPGALAEKISGGALWYDAQMLNSERLLLSILQSAVKCGATIANYVDVTEFKQDKGRLCSVVARDVLTDSSYTLSARLFVNCTGAWSDNLLAMLQGCQPPRTFHLSTAMNLVTRQILPDVALGLPSRKTGKEQILFVAPWQHYSLIGTWHKQHHGLKPGYRVDRATIQQCLDEVNTAYPAAALTQDDIFHVQIGYLPAQPTSTREKVKLVRESQIFDHASSGGPEALITVSGVKYTTALHTAAQVVDLSLRKLGRAHIPSRTSQTTVVGADNLVPVEDAQPDRSTARPRDFEPEVVNHLRKVYGSQAESVLGHLSEQPAWTRRITPSESVLGVEVIHGVRCEMAQTLTDVVRRRTPFGAVTLPSREAASACADLMAGELGWSSARRSAEINALYDSYDVYARDTNGTV